MKKLITIHILILAAVVAFTSGPASAKTTQIKYLSGHGRDDAVDWEFYCTKGRKSGKWTTIPVPSCWELHGFGAYNYGKGKKTDEIGKYRYTFKIPEKWKGKRIQIVFDGSMTDTEVSINGKSAGAKHQGAFYRFKYDITDLVKVGDDNLLEATVNKLSSNSRVNSAERDADYWVFGGIYRSVYLEALPSEFIDWTAIDARADGTFSVDVHLKHIAAAESVTAQILNMNGSKVEEPFNAKISIGQNKVTLRTKAANPEKWTAETPNLYKVKLTLENGKKTIHTVTERFGFRTIEVRPGEGIFLNGNRIRMKGVSRHSFRPESGRCLSGKDCYEDVRLIKEMNMNAVRMSHYPPDVYFLEACDELGLYVLDELAGWGSPPYDTKVGAKLVREMVTRDVNHPSVLFWNNGNEGGWNLDLDDDFDLYDPQKRFVLHPEGRQGIVYDDHYASYGDIKNRLHNSSTIYLTTEFLHGLYDGGHGAALNDYWNLMRSSPLAAGGFLWDFADEGVIRTDKDNWIDTSGADAADGILGPHMEKEGSFYTISQIWSPVQVAATTLPKDFDVTIELENQYDFMNLNQCTFKWQIVNFGQATISEPNFTVKIDGRLTGPDAGPGEKTTIKIPLPKNWQANDALYLTAINHVGKNLWTWSWPLKTHSDYRKAITETQIKKVKITATESGDLLTVNAGKLKVEFDRKTGKLVKIKKNRQEFSFTNGPCLNTSAGPTLASNANDFAVTHAINGDHCVVKAKNINGFEKLLWKVYANGLLEMNYQFQLSGKFDFFGINFDYPEDKMRAMKWLGQGPYRVWKNRMKGTTLGLWQRNYNDTATGHTWVYPEFKGYYADLRWVVFDTDQGSITVATDTQNLFLRVYTPKSMNYQNYRAPSFPTGDISFMHAIPPIGTKFKYAHELGPESQPNQAEGTYQGTLYFNFETK